jgi:hypothetical protein
MHAVHRNEHVSSKLNDTNRAAKFEVFCCLHCHANVFHPLTGFVARATYFMLGGDNNTCNLEWHSKKNPGRFAETILACKLKVYWNVQASYFNTMHISFDCLNNRHRSIYVTVDPFVKTVRVYWIGFNVEINVIFGATNFPGHFLTRGWDKCCVGRSKSLIFASNLVSKYFWFQSFQNLRSLLHSCPQERILQLGKSNYDLSTL